MLDEIQTHPNVCLWMTATFRLTFGLNIPVHLKVCKLAHTVKHTIQTHDPRCFSLLSQTAIQTFFIPRPGEPCENQLPYTRIKMP